MLRAATVCTRTAQPSPQATPSAAIVWSSQDAVSRSHSWNPSLWLAMTSSGILRSNAPYASCAKSLPRACGTDRTGGGDVRRESHLARRTATCVPEARRLWLTDSSIGPWGREGAGAIWPARAGDLGPARPARPDGKRAERPGAAARVVVDQPLWMDSGRHHLSRPDHLRRPGHPLRRPGRASAATAGPRVGRAAPRRWRNRPARVASDRQRSRRPGVSTLNCRPAARIDPYPVKRSDTLKRAYLENSEARGERARQRAFGR
jgi:hypothetical protein